MNQFIIIIIIIIIIFYFRRPTFIWALVNCQNSLIVERTPTKKLQHIITRISVGVRFIIYSSVSFKNTLPNKSEREAIRYVIYVWKSSFIDMVHCGVICNRMWERERERERERELWTRNTNSYLKPTPFKVPRVSQVCEYQNSNSPLISLAWTTTRLPFSLFSFLFPTLCTL